MTRSPLLIRIKGSEAKGHATKMYNSNSYRSSCSLQDQRHYYSQIRLLVYTQAGSYRDPCQQAEGMADARTWRSLPHFRYYKAHLNLLFMNIKLLTSNTNNLLFMNIKLITSSTFTINKVTLFVYAAKSSREQ